MVFSKKTAQIEMPPLTIIPDMKSEDCSINPQAKGSTDIIIPIEKSPSGEQIEETTQSQGSNFSPSTRKIGRFLVFLVAIAFLLIGRMSVPDNEVQCVVDEVLNALNFANEFINTPGNETFRNVFQALCSFSVDLTFIITFGYWVFRGNSGRLPITLAMFYITRALIQKIWFSPFPHGFYWESPGIPSLVVPYGRGSDFFFSGHSGFMVICALEWNKIGNTKIRNFVILAGIYTVLTLLVYQIHYSIDIFTGVFFADWCFNKVEANRERIDALWAKITGKLKALFGKIMNGQKFEKNVLADVQSA